MIHTMILILIILAAFSLLWWGINALSLPQPIKVVVLVILGLIALLFIYNMFSGSGSMSVPSIR